MLGEQILECVKNGLWAVVIMDLCIRLPGREKCSMYWRESSVQHCPLNHGLSWKAHNKQTCDNTQASVWVFRWGPSSEVLLSHCYCLVPTAAVGVDELAVDVLCPDWTKDICTCFACPKDPDLHKTAFSPKSGRTAYCIHQHLAEIPCIWHQEQKIRLVDCLWFPSSQYIGKHPAFCSACD